MQMIRWQHIRYVRYTWLYIAVHTSQVRGKREEINKCLSMLRHRFPPGRFPELNLQPVLPPPIPNNLLDAMNSQPSWVCVYTIHWSIPYSLLSPSVFPVKWLSLLSSLPPNSLSNNQLIPPMLPCRSLMCIWCNCMEHNVIRYPNCRHPVRVSIQSDSIHTYTIRWFTLCCTSRKDMVTCSHICT